MATTDYTATIQRILDILQEDTVLDRLVKEWRFGELPEQTQAHRWPAIYVTTAMNPEVSRNALTVSRTDNDTGLQTAPNQRIITEYWIVIVTSPAATPARAQKDLYTIQRKITSILTNNLHLQLRSKPEASPDINEQRLEAMAQYSAISSQSRLTMTQGKLVQSMTIMLRVTTVDDHQ